MNSRQWNKAVQILEVVSERDVAAKYYKKIAQHYSSLAEYEVNCTGMAFVADSLRCLVVSGDTSTCFGYLSRSTSNNAKKLLE